MKRKFGFADELLSFGKKEKEIKIDRTYGIAVIYKDKLLLAHPTNSKWWKSHTIPKGHKEPEDKTELDTALREFIEETGLDIIEHLPRSVFTSMELNKSLVKYKNKELIYFTLKIDKLEQFGLKNEIIPKEQLQLKEIDWAGFLTKEDAKKRIIEYQLPILENL